MKSSKSNTQLNEKDAILDLLESEKQLMSFYTTALFEGSSKSIRKNFSTHLNSVAENQYCLWSQMSSRGYVQPAPAQKQMIDQTCDQFKKQKKSLAE
ncbi:MAG: spore coat protein [Clostridia bacterium]|nr:spore coat protein [Clostridia bacterium]